MAGSPELSPPELQFERAEPVAAGQGAVVRCGLCKQPIVASYHEVGGLVACGDCRQKFEAALNRGTPLSRALLALLYGCGAALLATGIYFGVAAITGAELGLIAIFAGWLVGRAVRAGSKGRGGWFYQFMAVILVYVAIALSYFGIAVKHFYDHPEEWQETSQSESPASAPAEPPAGEESETSSQQVAELGPAAMTAGGFLGFILLVVFVLSLPIAVGIGAPMAFIIQAIALYVAWRTSKAVKVPVAGPFALRTFDAQQSSSTGRAPPPPPATG